MEDIGFTKHLPFLQHLPEEEAMTKLLSQRMKRDTLNSKTIIFESQTEKIDWERNIFFLKQGVAKFYVYDNGRSGMVRD